MKSKSNNQLIHIEKNAIADKGDGKIRFSEPLAITNDQEQRNGTRYDIASMDLSEYNGQLTANHSMDIQEIIGKVTGLKKLADRVVISGINFAVKENALARYAYNMIKSGFLTDFSIETYGPYPDDEGVYRNSKLVGLSAVVVGNNKSARLATVITNSIEQAKEDGLDTSILEGQDCYTKTDTAITNNAEETMGKQPVQETAPEVKENADEPKQEVDVAELIKNAISPLVEKIEKIEQNAFDKKAEEPKFAVKKTDNIAKMNWRERHGQQINHAWNWLKGGSQEAYSKLVDINSVNLEALQEKNIVANTITLADMGNFVISPELLTEIEGHRSDFSDFLGLLNFQETLSLQMAWLVRDGDISMSEVEMCDDGANGNLKPISEYEAEIKTANLHELAAVTPVCNAATRFLAADLLGDVAAGYRNDYDRKRAQLAIARMQQAVNTTGNVVTYSISTDVNSLKSFINAWSKVAEEVMNGVFVFSVATYGELYRRMIGSNLSGDTLGLFTTGNQRLLLGRPYVVVPNELMPELNTATTRSFTVEGSAVTINRGVFYFDPQTFVGRTSGGLQYDLSTEAAYEVSGTVKSAYQRNELVLRGSFFRNGAIKDVNKVSAMGAQGVS